MGDSIAAISLTKIKMSYINDALRKAQNERDSRYKKYNDIIQTAPAVGKVNIFGKWVIGIAVLSIVLLSTGAALYVYQDRWGVGTKKPVRQEPAVQSPPAVIRGDSLSEETLINGKWEAPMPDMTARAERFYREALDQQRKGHFEEAAILYERTLALDPNHHRALNNIGVIRMSENNNHQAIKAFERAILIKKDYVDPYYNLACVYSKLHNADAALGFLKKAASINVEMIDWARTDMDLKNLRTSPEFKSLIEKRGDQ